MLSNDTHIIYDLSLSLSHPVMAPYTHDGQKMLSNDTHIIYDLSLTLSHPVMTPYTHGGQKMLSNDAHIMYELTLSHLITCHIPHGAWECNRALFYNNVIN